MILKNIVVFAILSIPSFSGVSCMAEQSQDKSEWFVRPTSPEFPRTFGAHYTTDLHRYPGYGLVVWNYDTNRYQDQAGVSAQILAAARKCRQDF
ncbi:hypothetical protein Plim_0520 [Planctopirus limnophila DSM 3776]|uniref:Uncharacterized protein n=2 Tax=Planctopirus limnophila TaxID=120 RepID=D5SQB6_PLAL2|nr:hypothetical protein Plim_0520 [Planctopirus limnophila DSM 3776]